MAYKPGVETGVGLAAVVGVFWFANLLIGFTMPETKGVFGDQFGAVNALFSGLAFAGVAYALLMQRYEVSLLQEELARTKDILESQKTLADEQLAMQRKQAFETTFFNLVALLNEVVRAFEHTTPTHTFKGREIFLYYVIELKSIVREKKRGIRQSSTASGESYLQDAYEDLYSENASELGHYFRLLYNTIKFVDSSEREDKKFYTNIVRAQISDDEAFILECNVHSERGMKMKTFAEKYELFKNVSRATQTTFLSERRD